MISYRTFITIAMTLPWLAACDTGRETGVAETTEPPKVETEKIEWFQGSADEAFLLAGETGKPVYLYWGAVWCPPCQEIKHTVFKSKDFIALSKLFVPVYLDGDTPRAQAVGEQFGVQGYPTMIVFSPEGEEITRIPGGIDISRYNSVLALSLNRMKPTAELVRLARTDPGRLHARDYTQLAYYSWGQDFKVLEDDASFTLFRDLADLASRHDKIASARLYMQYLAGASSENTHDLPVRIDDAAGRLTDILSSDELVLACWDTLAYWPEITEILVLDEAHRDQLEEMWQERVLAMRHHESLSVAEQLAGWLPLLKFHYDRTEAPLADDRAKVLRRDLVAASRKTTNVYARQSVVYQINYVYQQARMFDEARDLLLAELDRSAAPYYFMSSLGSLAEKQERFDEAVGWYRKAWEASEGSATRFQWGASYVRAMIRMHPDDHDVIRSTAQSLLRGMDNETGVFTGRNFRVLRSLNREIDAWQADIQDERPGFVSRIAELCSRQTPGTLAEQNCLSLVSDDTAT